MDASVVMLRYVHFSTFNQNLYPLTYMLILRSVIEMALTQMSLRVENNLNKYEITEMLTEA